MAGTNHSGTDACESNEVLFKFYKGTIDEDLKKHIADHLDICDICLIKIRDFAFIESQFEDAEPFEKVPRHFMNNVTDALSKRTDVPSIGALQLAIQLTKGGLKVLKDTLLPPEASLGVSTGRIPAMVFRGESETDDSAILLEQALKDRAIKASMVAKRGEGDTANLSIRLMRSEAPISGARVSLKRKELLLESKSTDSAGSVNFAHVSPGRYTIWIPTQKIEWLIDIRI